MLRVEVFSEDVKLPRRGITKKGARTIAAAAAGLLGLESAAITVIMTSDDYIRGINKEYRGRNEPTDVVSFSNRDNPFPLAEMPDEEIGDIYISVDRIIAQAAEYGVTPPEELKRLIIHGVLHLVGYDHERSDADEEAMTRKEEDLFGRIDG